MEASRLALVEAFYPEGKIPLYLGDTVFHKTGPKIVGAGWHRDAVRSTGKETVHAFGLKLAVLSLRVNPPWGGEPLSLPVNMRLYRKKGGQTVVELAHDAVCETASWFEDGEFDLCADGFFYPLAGYPLERMSFTCGPSRNTRNTKQHLGGQEPQTWKGEGPERAAAFSFFLYSVIWLWYIQTMGTKISWIPLPWYPSKKSPSFIDALASLRRVLWRRILFPASGSEPLPDKIADTLIHVLSRAA